MSIKQLLLQPIMQVSMQCREHYPSLPSTHVGEGNVERNGTV